MKLVEVVILVGSQCLSPMQSGDGLTEVRKVPCAVLIREDPQTSDVEIVPQAAATDPDVIAMLVKPRKPDAVASNADDVTGSTSPAPPPPAAGVVKPRRARIVAAAAAPDPAPAADAAPPPDPKPVVKVLKPPPTKAIAVPHKRVVLTRRTDACGSYKAVWYTNKQGARRYRCVKTG